MSAHWMLLSLAILLEVLGTTCMKLSMGFTKPLYAVGMGLCYAACFGCLTQAIKHLEVGQAYAIWAGAGTALIALVGVVFFGESFSLGKAVSIVLIIAGVVGLRLFDSAP